MAKAIDKQTMLDLIIEAKRMDPEAGPFSEWLAEYLVDHLPTLTPPNEPLTLDELRKMKDEPVYLKVFDPLLERGWHTVYVPIAGMGVDYNLYRCPPKEGNERCEQLTGIHWRKK